MTPDVTYPHSTKARSGFTLVELLIVIAIMALVAGGAVMVYDEVQSRAEQSMARRQLTSVREALLRFRVDMGYFPGEGPLAPAFLNLDRFSFIDGGSINSASATTEKKVLWSAHPLNLWMLYEKPVSLPPSGETAVPANTTERWTWKPSIARGWQGPYLGVSLSNRLDQAGDASTGFTTGTFLNRLYAVPDLIQRGRSTATESLRWVSEDKAVTTPDQPVKTVLPNHGRPIAFIKDTVSEPGWAIYRVISAGSDGIFQTMAAPAGDDLHVEVSRYKL